LRRVFGLLQYQLNILLLLAVHLAVMVGLAVAVAVALVVYCLGLQQLLLLQHTQ
jgi:high-affinity Fe2+/Pb2+ permease